MPLAKHVHAVHDPHRTSNNRVSPCQSRRHRAYAIRWSSEQAHAPVEYRLARGAVVQERSRETASSATNPPSAA